MILISQYRRAMARKCHLYALNCAPARDSNVSKNSDEALKPKVSSMLISEAN